jgi:hypothetical protein
MADTPLAQALRGELTKYPGLDPRAVFAIAQHEGLSGGIGDQGTSFGPFQLHWGGAYPSFAPQGNPQAAQAWASSPAGIDYALGQIQGVAGGLTGREAIYNISSRFERPADVAGEVADAIAHYGAPLPTPVATPVAVAAAAPGRVYHAYGGQSVAPAVAGVPNAGATPPVSPQPRQLPPAVLQALAILRA